MAMSMNKGARGRRWCWDATGVLLCAEREQGTSNTSCYNENKIWTDFVLNVFDEISSRNLFLNLRFKLSGCVVHICNSPLFQEILV